MSSNKFDSRNRMRRHRRIRKKIEGFKDRPRLNVFRSSRHIYVQIINDDILSFKFLKFDYDCFFIGGPLKKKSDFDKLIQKIHEKNMKNGKKIYFIVVNVDKNKHEVFYKYKLIDSFQNNTKGYCIYSN